jgi:phage terminase small subunit
MTKTKLSPKQQLFIQEYLKHFCGTRAATDAGYAKNSARHTASRLLANVTIQETLAEAMEQRMQRLKVDADFVLQRHVEIDRLTIDEILNDDFTIKPLNEWTEPWKRYISSFDVQETIKSEEGKEVTVAFLKKIKFPDKLANLRLLGSHVDVQAYKEKTEVINNFRDMSMDELVERRNALAKKILEDANSK